jgi:hypothetical protein
VTRFTSWFVCTQSTELLTDSLFQRHWLDIRFFTPNHHGDLVLSMVSNLQAVMVTPHDQQEV